MSPTAPSAGSRRSASCSTTRATSRPTRPARRRSCGWRSSPRPPVSIRWCRQPDRLFEHEEARGQEPIGRGAWHAVGGDRAEPLRGRHGLSAAGGVHRLPGCGGLSVPLQRRPASGLPLPGREHDRHGHAGPQDDHPLRQAGQAAARDRRSTGLAGCRGIRRQPRHACTMGKPVPRIGSRSPARRRSCARPAATA